MKRSPLKRKSAIKRAPMARRKGSTKYARRERDMDRMAWIKLQMCCLAAEGDSFLCEGPTEAHHAGVRGLSQKAPDDTCIPLCTEHHRQLTDRDLYFSGWPRGAVKEWELEMVVLYRRKYEIAMRSPSLM